MNEILQWAILFMFLVLMLGLYRQVSLTVPASRRSSDEGPPLGRRLPSALVEDLADVLPRFKAADGATVAFITENCVGCQRLVADLNDSVRDLEERFALVVRTPSRAFMDALGELHLPIISDNDGKLWRSAQITATPLVVHIDGSGKVTRKEVTHDVRRVAPSTY